MSDAIYIGNRIKPRHKPTRTEHIYGRPYVFKDIFGDGHFVAQVSNAGDAELMLGQPDHFYLYKSSPVLQRGNAPAPQTREQEAEAARLAKAAADAEAAEKAAAEEAAAAAARAEAEAAAALAAKAAEGLDPALVAEAQALLAQDEKKIPTELQKLSGVPAIEAALAIEQASAKPRPKVVKLLGDAVALATGK